jgi:hypothetical protein
LVAAERDAFSPVTPAALLASTTAAAWPGYALNWKVRDDHFELLPPYGGDERLFS